MNATTTAAIGAIVGAANEFLQRAEEALRRADDMSTRDPRVASLLAEAAYCRRQGKILSRRVSSRHKARRAAWPRRVSRIDAARRRPCRGRRLQRQEL